MRRFFRNPGQQEAENPSIDDLDSSIPFDVITEELSPEIALVLELRKDIAEAVEQLSGSEETAKLYTRSVKEKPRLSVSDRLIAHEGNLDTFEENRELRRGVKKYSLAGKGSLIGATVASARLHGYAQAVKDKEVKNKVGAVMRTIPSLASTSQQKAFLKYLCGYYGDLSCSFAKLYKTELEIRHELSQYFGQGSTNLESFAKWLETADPGDKAERTLVEFATIPFSNSGASDHAPRNSDAFTAIDSLRRQRAGLYVSEFLSDFVTPEQIDETPELRLLAAVAGNSGQITIGGLQKVLLQSFSRWDKTWISDKHKEYAESKVGALRGSIELSLKRFTRSSKRSLLYSEPTTGEWVALWQQAGFEIVQNGATHVRAINRKGKAGISTITQDILGGQDAESSLEIIRTRPVVFGGKGEHGDIELGLEDEVYDTIRKIASSKKYIHAPNLEADLLKMVDALRQISDGVTSGTTKLDDVKPLKFRDERGQIRSIPTRRFSPLDSSNMSVGKEALGFRIIYGIANINNVSTIIIRQILDHDDYDRYKGNHKGQ